MRTSTKIGILLCFQFIGVSSFSQNLIVNGGFEIYKKCPDNLAQLNYATGWKDQNGGNGDYFNTCSTNKNIILSGKRKMPHSGNGYAGFCSLQQQYFEFIQTKFLNLLDTQKTYCLVLFLYKAPDQNSTIDELVLLFSKDENKTKSVTFHEDKLIKENNLIIYKLPQHISEWTAVRINYKPKNGEQFLTIGLNKLKNANREIIQQPYYYIDDVSLTEIKAGENCSYTDSTIRDYSTAINKPLTLQHITFQINSAILLESSYGELNGLAAYIKEHAQLKIELSGHTDNIGKEEDNLKLSGLRAKAVADYLIKQGIGKNRISYKGYGSTKSISDNTTEENRAKNRRVEVVFR